MCYITQVFYKEYVQDLILAKKQIPELTLLEIAHVYFAFWRKHQTVLKIFAQNELLLFILKKHNEYGPMIKKLNLTDTSSAHANYVMAFQSGGFFNILCCWIETGGKKKIAELCNCLKDL